MHIKTFKKDFIMLLCQICNGNSGKYAPKIFSLNKHEMLLLKPTSCIHMSKSKNKLKHSQNKYFLFANSTKCNRDKYFQYKIST